MAYPELSWANIVLGKQVVVGSTPISRSTFSDTELPPDGESGGFPDPLVLKRVRRFNMARWNVPLWVVVEAEDSLGAFEQAEELADQLSNETGTTVMTGEPQEATGLGGH